MGNEREPSAEFAPITALLTEENHAYWNAFSQKIGKTKTNALNMIIATSRFLASHDSIMVQSMDGPLVDFSFDYTPDYLREDSEKPSRLYAAKVNYAAPNYNFITENAKPKAGRTPEAINPESDVINEAIALHRFVYDLYTEQGSSLFTQNFDLVESENNTLLLAQKDPQEISIDFQDGNGIFPRPWHELE